MYVCVQQPGGCGLADLDRLLGVIVHYWNGKVMMHAKNHDVLDALTVHLKKNISRPVAGILGPSAQAEQVIKGLNLMREKFSLNSIEGLYALNVARLDPPCLAVNERVVPIKDLDDQILTQWMRGYEIEALNAPIDADLAGRVENKVNRLRQGDCQILVQDSTPVSLVGINARLADSVQVGPVWTPPDYRNRGFARRLLAHTLHQEKLKGTTQAILFAGNLAAIKAYLAVGFEQIGDYRLALLEKPASLEKLWWAIEFTTSPEARDMDFLTHKINQETPEFGQAHPFAFFIRDAQNQIIAGCNGSVIFGSIYTDQLWVDPDHRKNGLGRQLMDAVHDYGRRLGCFMATACTMSFQGAKTFYENLGYTSDFERSGHTNGSGCIFLKRVL
jgi:GNAT superfamily N-acetyltransferase